MATRRAPFVIGEHTVAPGERRTIDLPITALYTHTPLTMPVQVVHGRRDGPVLFVSAAVHGDEINGVEIIRRLLQQNAFTRLSGTLIAVPIVNVHGFLNHSRYLPDRRDLNRCFPGSETGSVAGRLAYRFVRDVVSQADYGIDLHTAAVHRDNYPQIRANLDDPETDRLARAFGLPVILNASIIDGSLRGVARDMKIPILIYEAGEALRFDELSIRAGLRGVLSVMRELDMLAPSRRRRARPEPTVARSSSWVRAASSGVLRARVRLGSRVRKGELLGVVTDPFGEMESGLPSPFDGIVIGRTNLPLANEGDALFHIARVDAPGSVEAHLEAFEERVQDGPAGGGEEAEPPIV